MTDVKIAEKYVSQNKDFVITTLTEFVLTDTILFWSENTELKTLQKQKWQPILDWLGEVHNMHFCTTEDFCLPQENEKTCEAFSSYLRTLSLKKLTALYLAATNMKSPLLAVAMIEQKLSADDAFNLAFLEELFQADLWGKDVAAENLRHKIKDDLSAVGDYIKNGMLCAD